MSVFAVQILLRTEAAHPHTEAKQRTLLTFFVEVDRTQMTIARVAQKLHAYVGYHEYAPQAAKGQRGPRRHAGMAAWRYRYPAFPRLLLILTGASEDRLARRISYLRSLAASDPALASTPLRVGVTTLDQLRSHGPFEPVFTPVLGRAEFSNVWLRPVGVAS
ncbi:hypothetical protein ACIOMM_35760 [Streptomyces sp. NPDC087908]|uniref:hypothetical protein n=1 Tax=Streptomyces sp. NPDC087908 TaxID=3365820 RepID=UPI0037F9ADC8